MLYILLLRSKFFRTWETALLPEVDFRNSGDFSVLKRTVALLNFTIWAGVRKLARSLLKLSGSRQLLITAE